MRCSRIAVPVCVLGALVAPAADAAESYDSCLGFIASLPATITTQGVWCLDKDLATSLSSGNAIHVDANNVTIDCNGFKVGGLAAGPATTATGLYSTRLNTVVRGCNIRGFRIGGLLVGAGGVVEDNRFEANTSLGLIVEGEIVARRNFIIDTGGAPASAAFAVGLGGGADFTDNRIEGAVSGNGSPARGISVGGGPIEGAHSVTIRDNVVSGISDGNGVGYAIHFGDPIPAAVSGNVFVREPAAATPAISCTNIGDGQFVIRDNTMLGYGDWDPECIDGGGNWPDP